MENQFSEEMYSGTPKKEEYSKIVDSGNRTEFATGARRDISEGKGYFTYGDLETIGAFFSSYRDDKTISLLSNVENKENLFEIFNDFIKRFYDGDIATALLKLAVHYENGAKKYAINNWKKGIPTDSFINSAIRHYLKIVRGDNDEDHKSAFLFNIMGIYYNFKE